MTEVALTVCLPAASLVAGYYLARWSQRRQLARQVDLVRVVGPPPSEVDAAIERHFHTLPTWLKGEQS